MLVKSWKRECPVCRKVLSYKNKKDFQRACRYNKLCRSCGQKKNHNRNEWKLRQKLSHRKQIPWNKGKTGVYSDSVIARLKIASSHPMSVSTRKNISAALAGRIAHNRGVPHSEETKRKIRLSVVKLLKERFGENIYPLYNPRACKYIDEYGKKNGYNFQHALNGGEFLIEELGYWVDGYDKEKNVVIEYYEPHHKRQITKDALRKKQIMKHLKCKFIEIREW